MEHLYNKPTRRRLFERLRRLAERRRRTIRFCAFPVTRRDLEDIGRLFS